MNDVIIEQRDLTKKIHKRIIGNNIDSHDLQQQEFNNPMVYVKDDCEKVSQIDFICYNGRWFTVVSKSEQKRLQKEWEERKI